MRRKRFGVHARFVVGGVPVSFRQRRAAECGAHHRHGYAGVYVRERAEHSPKRLLYLDVLGIGKVGLILGVRPLLFAEFEGKYRVIVNSIIAVLAIIVLFVALFAPIEFKANVELFVSEKEWSDSEYKSNRRTCRKTPRPFR